MTLQDLYLSALRDRYSESDSFYTLDKHNAYKPGDIAEWKDGFHQKTNHGWIKLPAKERPSKKKGSARTYRDQFDRNVSKYLGKTFVNKHNGIKAEFTKDSLRELKSQMTDTKNNGFTMADHFEMINQIKYLFETASFIKEHPDVKHNDEDVRIKRLLSRPVKLKSGRRARACITLKYTISKNHQAVYSLEGMEIKKAFVQAKAKGEDQKAISPATK